MLYCIVCQRALLASLCSQPTAAHSLCDRALFHPRLYLLLPSGSFHRRQIRAWVSIPPKGLHPCKRNEQITHLCFETCPGMVNVLPPSALASSASVSLLGLVERRRHQGSDRNIDGGGASCFCSRATSARYLKRFPLPLESLLADLPPSEVVVLESDCCLAFASPTPLLQLALCAYWSAKVTRSSKTSSTFKLSFTQVR